VSGCSDRVIDPRPQVVVQYYDGFTGRLQYAEAIVAK
jgi:hypothetical protein